MSDAAPPASQSSATPWWFWAFVAALVTRMVSATRNEDQWIEWDYTYDETDAFGSEARVDFYNTVANMTRPTTAAC